MQKAVYRIRFVSGELSGRTFLIPPDGILIGKSRSAAIRPGDEEIGIEHASLRYDEKGALVLEALAEKVAVRGTPLEPKAECRLEPGSDVMLGDRLSFVVDEDDAPAVPPPAAGIDAADEETVDDTADTAGDAGGAPEEETGGSRTRYASALELDDLRSLTRRRVRRRRLVLSTGALLILLIFGGGYFYSELRQENPVTWPGQLTGVYHDDEFRIQLPPDGKFLIYYPKCAATVVRTGGDSCEVLTLLGRDLDVPFHLELIVNTLPDGFRVTREEGFKRWSRHAAEEEGFAFLSAPESLFYAMDSGGYPYQKIGYRRKVRDIQWQGIACYSRYGDREIIFLREVPFQHFWRAAEVVDTFSCFVASPDAAKSYWEIPEKIPEGVSSADLYKQVMVQMSENVAVSDWKLLKSRFALLLSLACIQKDEGMKKDAFALWREFRERQQLWYSRACLAYQHCQMNDDMNGMRRILDECLRKFPDPDDCRHTKIIRNIWTINL